MLIDIRRSFAGELYKIKLDPSRMRVWFDIHDPAVNIRLSNNDGRQFAYRLKGPNDRAYLGIQESTGVIAKIEWAPGIHQVTTTKEQWEANLPANVIHDRVPVVDIVPWLTLYNIDPTVYFSEVAEVRILWIPDYKDTAIVDAGETLVERGEDFVHFKIASAGDHEVAWNIENVWIFGAHGKISGIAICDLTPEQIETVREIGTARDRMERSRD
jgi:hypothetical protein